MIRKLELLIVAVVLVVAAFSTALPFLFYLLYLAILVIGGSYVLVRLGLTDLEAGYAVSQLHGHVGDRMRVTYTLRNAQPDPEAVARDPQPDDAARRPARPGDHPRRPDRAVVAHPRAAVATRPLPDRAAAHPDRRPVRLLRGLGDGRAGDLDRRLSAARAAARAGACRRRPSRAATPRRCGPSRRRRWRRRSGRTRPATR